MKDSTPEDDSKLCIKCRVRRPLADFHKMQRWRDRKCKVCKSLYDRKRYRENREIIKQRHEDNRKSHMDDYRARYNRVYHRDKEQSPNKLKARTAVAEAVKKGHLLKSPCEVCQNINSQFHHGEGYAPDKWLVGKWLCWQHHADAHAEVRNKEWAKRWSMPLNILERQI